MKLICRAAVLALAVSAGASQTALALSEEPTGKLFSATSLGGEEIGSAAAISGTTAVLGAPSENSGTGAVYVFVKNAGTWTFQARLIADDDVPNALPGTAGDQFGASVSIHGDDIAVGAPGRAGAHGAVYTFTRSGTTWTQDAPILTGAGAAAGDNFGRSVSIETSLMAVGAPFEAVGTKAAQGATYAYAKNAGVWSFAPGSGGARITETRGNSRAGDHIGWSVSLSGNTIMSGAPDDDFGNKVNRGSVWVYVRNGQVWTRQARLNPGGQAQDRAGSAVAIFSNSAVVGASGHNVGNAADQGQAYSYSRTGTSWSLQNTVLAPDGAAGDLFGSSVAVSGPYAVVGAPSAGSGGKTYLYGNGGFLQQLVATDNAAGDEFGTSASFDSGRALVGAPGADANSVVDSGAGYVFGIVTPTITAITGDDLGTPTASGDAYTVRVLVTCDPAALICVPTGTVNVDDGDGATCQVTLAVDVPNVGASGTCQLTSVAPGLKTVTANYLGTLLFGASSDSASHDVTGGDLAVFKTDNTDIITEGGINTYTIVVANPGDFDATGVQVIDNLPVELSNASWTCTPQAGGTCPNPASGTGNLDALVDLLSNGGQVTFLITVDVAGGLLPGTTFIENTATIVPGANGDLNPNNNTSTDSDDVVVNAIFSDGFEGDPAKH